MDGSGLADWSRCARRSADHAVVEKLLQLRTSVGAEQPSDRHPPIGHDDLLAGTCPCKPVPQVCSEFGHRNVHPASVQIEPSWNVRNRYVTPARGSRSSRSLPRSRRSCSGERLPVRNTCSPVGDVLIRLGGGGGNRTRVQGFAGPCRRPRNRWSAGVNPAPPAFRRSRQGASESERSVGRGTRRVIDRVPQTALRYPRPIGVGRPATVLYATGPALWRCIGAGGDAA